MTLVTTYVGKVSMLSTILNKTELNDLQLRLFINNVLPEQSDTVLKYTELPSNLGYSAVTLSGSSWSINQGDPCVATYPEVTITFTSSLSYTIYGYYITESSTNILMWVERFASPYNANSIGDKLIITPRITLG